MRTPVLARVVLTALLLAGVPLLAGCGNSKAARTGRIAGRVVFQGKPVTAGAVKLFSETDPNRVFRGDIGPDSSFRISEVPYGTYRVAVETLSFRTMARPPAGLKVGAPQPVYVPIPAKYERPETSGLTHEVQQKQAEWDLEL